MTDKYVVSQSEMSTFQSCKRKWFYNYIRRLTRMSRRPDALSQGTIFHYGLEHRHAEDWRTPLAEYVAAMLEETPEWEAEILKQHELAEIMIDGLIEWAAEEGLDAGVEVLGHELVVEADMGFYTLRGKLDEVIRDNGLIGFRDFKSAGDGFAIFDTAAVDRQFRTYYLATEKDPAYEGGAAFGEWVVARKVKRTARSKPPFYGRHRTHYTPTVIESLRLQYETVMRDLLHRLDMWTNGSYHQDRLYPPNPDRMKCRMCPYADICAMQDNGSDVEGYIEDRFTIYDPNARYADDPSPS